jgi:hypothetical protein
MQIENVIACHLVDTERGAVDDRLKDLAECVDYYFWQQNEDPHSDVRDWIERTLKRDAFETPRYRRERIESQRIDYAIDIARGK